MSTGVIPAMQVMLVPLRPLSMLIRTGTVVAACTLCLLGAHLSGGRWATWQARVAGPQTGQDHR